MSTYFMAPNVDKITHQVIIKTGYISRSNYRNRFQYDSEMGVKERESLLSAIKIVVEDINFDGCKKVNVFRRGNNFTLQLSLFDQTMTINFDTINSIVTQNKDRKINKQCYLPFDKSMDKYNSAYVTIETNCLNNNSYNIAEEIIGNIMGRLIDTCYFKSMSTNPIFV